MSTNAQANLLIFAILALSFSIGGFVGSATKKHELIDTCTKNIGELKTYKEASAHCKYLLTKEH